MRSSIFRGVLGMSGGWIGRLEISLTCNVMRHCGMYKFLGGMSGGFEAIITNYGVTCTISGGLVWFQAAFTAIWVYWYYYPAAFAVCGMDDDNSDGLDYCWWRQAYLLVTPGIFNVGIRGISSSEFLKDLKRANKVRVPEYFVVALLPLFFFYVIFLTALHFPEFAF